MAVTNLLITQRCWVLLKRPVEEVLMFSKAARSG